MHIIHALSVPPALYTHTRIHVILRVHRFTVHRHHPMPLLCSIAEISFNIISSSQSSSPTTLCFNDNYLKIQILTAAKATTLTTALMEAVMTAVVTEAAEEMTTGLMTLGVGL